MTVVERLNMLRNSTLGTKKKLAVLGGDCCCLEVTVCGGSTIYPNYSNLIPYGTCLNI